MCKLLIEVVNDGAKEDAENCCGKTFALEHSLCDGEKGE